MQLAPYTEQHTTMCVCVCVTGAKERGELENRVTKLIQEVRDAGNVVLM